MGPDETAWDYFERWWWSLGAVIGAHLPSTISPLELWWLIVGLIGVVASAYDIYRSEQEIKFHWNPEEKAERGVSRFSMFKSVCLGVASAANLMVGLIAARLPQAPPETTAHLIGNIIAGALILVEVLIVATTIARDVERLFLAQFVWHVRERTPDDPPIHAPRPPIGAPPEGDGDA